jgi:hypothetical protein
VKDPAEYRVKVRDVVLAAPRTEVFVLRPNGAPSDTVAGFIVLTPGLFVHWMGVKRTFRGLGLGLRLVLEAEKAGAKAFGRVGGWRQRAFLEGRGWVYAPRLEVISCS